MKLTIRPILQTDAETISDSFSTIGWHKPASQYRRYTREQASGTREVLVAWAGSSFAGYCTILWKSKYPYFRKWGIPEIMDLNVLPKFQKKKIGTRLMDRAEAIIKKRSSIAGIGVGLAPGYNAAQRMYVKRGYVPDGLGVVYRDRFVKDGERIRIDDSLVLHFTKKII